MSIRACVVVVCVVGFADSLAAEVTRWEILSRTPYADGKPRGDRGVYERWTGRVHFAVDPSAAANRKIVDLELAAKNAAGKVEFSADFEMLVPRDRSRANGALFYEVNNRGNKTAPGIIEGGADDFLCRQGFVVLWSGWIAEVLPGAGRLRLQAPVPILSGKPLRGIVRNELVVDRGAMRASISHRGNQGSFRPAAAPSQPPKLTRRVREADPRQTVPRDQWNLIVSEPQVNGQVSQLPLVELEARGGLQPGWIYEVQYEAEGSLVQGAGLAAIRDIVAALKYGPTAETNPLRGPAGQPLIRRALGFGTSQSGRCLRHFLWEGFNADEQGRRVFNGILSHVAGGGLGSFNHRFASPTRTNGQHEEHLFPADYFPFAYGDATDPLSGATDGILSACRRTNTIPKVFHTQSASEYWHRSGSLVHTDPMGMRDAEIPSEVRIYTFGGAQHGPGSGVPAGRSVGQLAPSPVDYRPLMRSLVVELDAWVADGSEPPPSVFPRLADRTLVDWQQEHSGWPATPGIPYPVVIQQPAFLYRGPDWVSKRVATVEPPEIRGRYGVKVPAVGADGNTLGTLDVPAVAVPIGTYTSWNLRGAAIGAEGELLSLQGGFIPFAKTKAQREAAKDPRPSLVERYGDFAGYETRYASAVKKLLAERYIRTEDVRPLMELCRKFQPWFDADNE